MVRCSAFLLLSWCGSKVKVQRGQARVNGPARMTITVVVVTSLLTSAGDRAKVEDTAAPKLFSIARVILLVRTFGVGSIKHILRSLCNLYTPSDPEFLSVRCVRELVLG